MQRVSGLKVLLAAAMLLFSLYVLTPAVGGFDVPPEVVSTSPASGETNVSLLANISVIFNKQMNTTTEKWNITPYIPLTTTWWDNYTLNLTHSTQFSPATNYWVGVSANNTQGTVLRHTWYRWRFTTTCGGPCIVETSPPDGAMNVGLTASIVVKLSEGLDVLSVAISIVPSITFTSSWSSDFKLLTLNHAPFDVCTTYTVTLSGGGLVPGPAPNPWSFTTSCPGARFVDVAASKGFSGIDGGFFAWGDYNRDGYEDLLIDGKRLYRNNGPPNYDFTDVTALAGIGNTSVNNGVWGDYNNDGWLDFYAPGGGWSTNAGPQAPWDILWMNNGDGTFTNVTAAAGTVKDIYPSVAAGWADYDRDGYIDLYVANYESEEMAGYPDRLWHNDGDGTFTDVTGLAGIVDAGMSAKPGRGVAWGDYNNDGLQDVYISNYRITANYLWKNNGDRTFTDVATATNTTGWHQTENLCYDYFSGQKEWGKDYGHTIGSAWADFDNDGDLDVFSANLAHKHVGNVSGPPPWYDMRGYITDDSRFFRNDGAPNYDFTDIRVASGLPLKPIFTWDQGQVDSPFSPCVHTYYPTPTWIDELFGNVMWTDYDLDGWQDMWLVQVYGQFDYAYSYLLRNNHDGTFYEVAPAANTRVWGGDYAGAWADYNDDGWPDLVTHGQYPFFGAPSRIRLFENQGTNNSWLKVKLNGCTSNTAAIGARVLATANGMTQMRNVEAGSGSHSQMNSLIQHFGFGDYYGAVDLHIIWPNGNSEDILGVAVNQTLRLQEAGCDAPARVRFLDAGLSGGSGANVVLTWPRVMGDDGWIVNITEYAVYYGAAYDPTAVSYQFLGSVPAGTTTFTHVGGGIGDSNTYYYAIQTNGTGGTIRSIAQAVKFAKHLTSGEQLVSIPVPISSYSIDTVLRGVPFDHARIYDGSLPDPWLSYVPGRQHNDFDTFAPYQAFWLGVTGDSYFTVAGPIFPSASIQLRAGWNLVGYPSTLPRTVGEAVAGLGGSFRAMEGYDPSTAPYHLRRLGLSDVMYGGEGYWILVASATVWSTPFQP